MMHRDGITKLSGFAFDGYPNARLEVTMDEYGVIRELREEAQYQNLTMVGGYSARIFTGHTLTALVVCSITSEVWDVIGGLLNSCQLTASLTRIGTIQEMRAITKHWEYDVAFAAHRLQLMFESIGEARPTEPVQLVAKPRQRLLDWEL